MAKIDIETIKKELQEDGWKLISTEYKNLDTELVFECNEGHRVFSNWKKIRNSRICPVCQTNRYKISEMKILPKKKNSIRVIGLDQATYTTGFSIFCDGELETYGVFQTSLDNVVERNNAVKNWLISMVENWKPDYVALEDIQLQQLGGKQVKNADNVVGVQTFKILAQLQGVLLNTLFELGVPTEVVYPATWRAHCQIKGRTKVDRKRSMQIKVKEWFDVSVSDDEADAIGIGKFLVEVKGKPTIIENWE